MGDQVDHHGQVVVQLLRGLLEHNMGVFAKEEEDIDEPEVLEKKCIFQLYRVISIRLSDSVFEHTLEMF